MKETQEQQASLPRLIKMSSTYRMFIPKKVEEKIRYLIRKFPHTEWSGVLFYNHSGSFEENNLEIYCEDLFPMDLGSAGWTEFKMTPDVTAYITENIELFDCETGLIHSHHSMGAFFSGQDTKTLQIEGSDTNCFVSLIVDTKGTYQAAITRKMQTKTEVVTKSLGTSYEFFGEGTVATGEDPMTEVTQIVDEEVIEYFMLDVEREVVNNSFDYLDQRFEEIEQKKKEHFQPSGITFSNDNNDYNKDPEFFDWIHKSKQPKELPIWTNDPVAENKTYKSNFLHKAIVQMLTCSLIINPAKVNLDKWVINNMEKLYKELFTDSSNFDAWCDFIFEFITSTLMEEEVAQTYTETQSLLAEDLIGELSKYSGINSYIDDYTRYLENYLI